MTGADDSVVKELETALPPALERFLETARARVLERASAAGYGPGEAEWIERRMRGPLLQRIADGAPVELAFPECYEQVRRALLVEIFDRAVAEGADRAAAFTRLVDLEIAMAMRRGEPPPAYSRALVEAGGEAATAAAAEGGTTEQQINTGFAMMRDLAPHDPVAGS